MYVDPSFIDLPVSSYNLGGHHIRLLLYPACSVRSLGPADGNDLVSHGQDSAMATDEDDFADVHHDTPLPILVRATNGKSKEKRSDKVKLATVVQSDALEAFYARYAEVCRAGMSSLKPRDRSKRKAKARKKKGGPAGVGAA